LAVHLPPEQRAQVLSEALTAAQAIDDESNRASALSALAPHLLPEQLSQALKASLAISEDSPRASALSALAPHSPRPSLRFSRPRIASPVFVGFRRSKEIDRWMSIPRCASVIRSNPRSSGFGRPHGKIRISL
jgi:hypothetical protein